MTAAAPFAARPTRLLDAAEREATRIRVWSDVGRIAAGIVGDGGDPGLLVAALAARMGDVRATSHESAIRVGGRCFWDLNCPGWPSPAFDSFIRAELARFIRFPGAPASLQTLMVAITTRCPLRCEHCSEWDRLNTPEVLSRDDLLSIIGAFQDRGLAQVQLSGGEPLSRFDDLLEVVKRGAARSDVWVLTSGHGLTEARAEQLRAAGLTGVQVSLDDWDPERHDAFRGMPGSFSRACRAAVGAARADLVVCLNLCATRPMASAYNLRRYRALATELGAAFIQILEPRAIGHWRDRDVALSPAKVGELEAFFLGRGRGPGEADAPIITYHGYGQRRLGCPSAGDRFLFVDSDGRAHACPFCPGPVADCRHEGVDAALAGARARGCSRYPCADSTLEKTRKSGAGP